MRSFIKSRLAFGVLALSLATLVGCDKTKPYDTEVAPAQAHFTRTGYLSYYVQNDPNSSFTVPIGTTNVSNSDRQVTVNVTSTSGAVAGTHYTLPATTVTIPGGEAVADFTIKGIFAPYAGGDRDTLRLTLAEPSVPTAKFQDTVYVVLQRYCNVVLTSLAGAYPRTFEGEGNSYGPYTSTLTNVVSTGATSATATLLNLYDSGIPVPIVKFDWSNPANFRVVIDEQFTGAISAGNYIWVRTAGSQNTFSSCDNTVSFRYDLLAKTPAGGLLGYYELNYPMYMSR